jgi:hypothetical protein
MLVWLIKQTKKLASTKSITEAAYALLMQGTDWSSLQEAFLMESGQCGACIP